MAAPFWTNTNPNVQHVRVSPDDTEGLEFSENYIPGWSDNISSRSAHLLQYANTQAPKVGAKRGAGVLDLLPVLSLALIVVIPEGNMHQFVAEFNAMLAIIMFTAHR